MSDCLSSTAWPFESVQLVMIMNVLQLRMWLTQKWPLIDASNIFLRLEPLTQNHIYFKVVSFLTIHKRNKCRPNFKIMYVTCRISVFRTWKKFMSSCLLSAEYMQRWLVSTILILLYIFYISQLQKEYFERFYRTVQRLEFDCCSIILVFGC